MTQNLANFAQSTLSSAITSGATSLTVASFASFKDPSGAALAAPFVIQIESEILNVTAVAGTTLTVSRGQEGTTAAAHASGVTVVAPITALALQNLPRLAHVGAATPTGGSSGDVRVGTGKLWINDAGTWKSVTIA